jgi:hypothetical protein
MQGLDGWVQAKITKAADYLSSVRKYLEGKTTQGVEETKQRLDPKCWTGKHKEGTKIKGGIRVNNCVPNESVEEGLSQTLRKVVPGYAKREIDKKMDAEKFGRTDVDRDANYYRYKKIQDKIKEQGVAEGWKSKLAGAAVTAGIDAYARSQAKKKQAKQNASGDQSVDEGSEKMTPREKFNRGLKRQGFDPEAAANRLEKLIAKQKQEREEFEKARPDVYSKKEVDEQLNAPQYNPKRAPLKRAARVSEEGVTAAPSAGDNSAYANYAGARAKGDLLSKEMTPDTGGKAFVSPLARNITTDLTTGLAGSNPEMEKRYQMNRLNAPKLDQSALAAQLEERGVAEEKQGLWANIHAKRERIQHGSGERMRKPGSKGAPTAAALNKSAKE